MAFLKQFKEFALKGNVVDLAVAVIIGGAFGKIVTSLVNDIVMPPLGILIGGIRFKDLHWVLKEASGEENAITLNYGMFIQNVVDFLIIAMAIFIVIHFYKKLERKKEQEVVETASPKLSVQESLLTEIRDLLQKKN